MQMTPDESPDPAIADDHVLAMSDDSIDTDDSFTDDQDHPREASTPHNRLTQYTSDHPPGAGEDILLADDPRWVELARPFIGQWNTLISTTNWEKGRIISQWRETLIASGSDATEYSDEAWARRVGGVTAPHVGRLRRVYDRFGSTYQTYAGVYWSHFLAALDWDDAPLWLEGAVQENWSVSQMREQRWQAQGAVESQRPTSSEVIEVDTDEDVVLPAQGGGRTREFDDQLDGVAVGPIPEGPDFGDEEELSALGGTRGGEGAGGGIVASEEDEPPAMIQPFKGLPDLPPDLSDAIEAMKLSILRHKSAGWRDVDVDTVQKYLDAMSVLLRV